MALLGWFRRETPDHEADEEDLAALVKEFRELRTLVSLLSSTSLDGVPDGLMQAFKAAEQAVIAALEDPFQREIFAVLAKHGFDILDFLDGDWIAILGDVLRVIVAFLGQRYPAGGEWQDYPFSGEELYLWLLERTKGSSDRVVAIFANLEKTSICGFDLGFEARRSLSDRLIVVFAGEYTKRSAAFIDIFCDVEGGEEFIREELAKAD
jgi:hypothetical protein